MSETRILQPEDYLPNSSFMWKDGSKDQYTHPVVLEISRPNEIQIKDGLHDIVFVIFGDVDFSMQIVDVDSFMGFLLQHISQMALFSSNITTTYARLYKHQEDTGHDHLLTFSPNQDLGNSYVMYSDNNLEEVKKEFERNIKLVEKGLIEKLIVEENQVFKFEEKQRFLISKTTFYGDHPEDPNQNLMDQRS